MAAENCRASGNAGAGERPPTRETGLARAPVHRQHLLLAAYLSPRVAVGVDRAAAVLDRRLQGLAQGLVQTSRGLAADALRDPVGADAGLVEGFVRVDVADARERLLVEQHRLQRRLSPAQRPVQRVRG